MKIIPLISAFTTTLLSINTMAENVPIWAEGLCSYPISQGANRNYYNRGTHFKWGNFMGDWKDSTGVAQGDSTFATLTIPDLDEQQSLNVNLTSMVSGWLSNSYPNQGIFIKNSSRGKASILSKEYENSDFSPTLTVQTSDGVYSLKPQADTVLRSYTYVCGGDLPELNTVGNILLNFDLSVIPDNSQVLDAQLSLSTSENQYGASNLEFYRVAIAAKAYSGEALASRYPNDYRLIDDPSVLFVETFEREDWVSNWSSVSTSHELVTENSSEKFIPLMGKSLQSKLITGELTALSATYGFMDKLGSDQEEIYFRYNLRFGNTWETLLGGKLPGIAGTYPHTPYEGGWGGRTSNGTNGWSARGVFYQVLKGNNPFAEHVPIGNYIYHADQDGTWGDSIIYDGEQPGVLEKNKWYSIEQYVKINTPGLNDGIIRAWIDGELAYERKGLKFRNEGYDNIKIDRIWMNIYHGGTKPNDRDVYAFIDNVVIAKEYIGPINYNVNMPLAGTEPNRKPVITSNIASNLEINAFQSLAINTTVTDADGDTVELEWFLNGESTGHSLPDYEYTSDYFNLGQQTIELKARDSKDGLTVRSWTVTVSAENFVTLSVEADTYITTSTYQSNGYKDVFSLSTYGQNTSFLRFPQLNNLSVNEIKSVTLILHDYAQYGVLELDIYAGTDSWVEGEDINDGATRDYSDRGNFIEWNNYMGDWYDRANVMNGTESYLSIQIPDTDSLKKVHLDITRLVQDHLDDSSINIVL